MKTKFTIIKAVQGTTEKEIKKAKQRYFREVEKNNFSYSKNIQISFFDSNCKITANFIDLETFENIGKTEI